MAINVKNVRLSNMCHNQTVRTAYDMPCTKIKGWECDICAIVFRWKKDMRKHIESVHQITVRRECNE